MEGSLEAVDVKSIQSVIHFQVAHVVALEFRSEGDVETCGVEYTLP
jgi:hypothetical protein